jgi:medium-chain acyl-[acyl-carrier-protein] hydrolase
MTTKARQRNPWISFRSNTPSARARLFCLPYAGAGASIFRSWVDLLPQDIELCGVQLPGREDRTREPAFTRMEPLVEELALQLISDLDMPFAVFGHSMGALITFELARCLRRNGLPTPAHLFVSGRRGPQVACDLELFHDLPDSRLIERVRELNGTREDVLRHPEIVAFLLPILKADFSVVETYSYKTEREFECAISAFGGLADTEVPRADLAAWGAHTRGPFRIELFPGHHFFLNDSRASLLATIAADLRQTLSFGSAKSSRTNGA